MILLIELVHSIISASLTVFGGVSRQMDEPTSPIASPLASAAQDAPRKKRRGCFFYGCLTTIALVVLFAIGVFALFQYGRTNVTPVAEEFLAAVESGNYDAAYASAGDEWKQVSSKDEFPVVFKLVQNTLGSRKSLSLSSFHIQTNNRGTFARAVYSAEYDNGNADLTFTLKKYDGQWRIIGLHYDSPLLNLALKCPKCNAANAPSAKFCAQCGAQLPQP